jgi:hypothetical protein
LIRLDENDEIAATSKIEEQDVPEEGEIAEIESVTGDTSTKSDLNVVDDEPAEFDDTINNEGADTPEA